jgi:hypothetical protein
VLIGHSSGGVLATYAAATRPLSFPFVVAIDAPTHLGEGWLAEKLIASADKPATDNLRYVSLEARFGWSDAAWQSLIDAAPPSWKLHRTKLEHESHTSMGFLATYLGLREVFGDYSTLAAPESPTKATLTHYQDLTDSYGDAQTPPRPLLSRLIDDFLMEGRAPEAHTALDTLIAGYGDFAGSDDARARIAEAAKLPPLTETVENLLATAMPDPKVMLPFLGEWNGTQRFGDGPPQPVRLRLEVRDGKVAGSWINWPAPEVELAMPLQYIKVVEGGVDLGFMNGMRPRGMLMHEARLHDGKLEGEVRFRGIRFTPPEGARPPTVRFSLEHTRKDTPP